MDKNDILGIGKILPIDKLIDVVSTVTSRISKSYFEKKDVDTKAYEIRKLAEAKAEEIKIISSAIRDNHLLTGGIEYKDSSLDISSPKQLQINNPNLDERIKDRLVVKESKKQLNIETVTAYAAEQLVNALPVSDVPLDEDWKTRFFNIVEDISSEEMQDLWGQILAGEIKQPKSYSLRTLELLRNLSKEEAKVFEKLAKAKIVFGSKNVVYNPDDGGFLQSEFGITFSDRLLLRELGLISSENNLQLSVGGNDEPTSILLILGSKAILLDREANISTQSIEVIVFSKVGIELSGLIEPVPTDNYLRKIAFNLKHPGTKTFYGDLIPMPNGTQQFGNAVEVS